MLDSSGRTGIFGEKPRLASRESGAALPRNPEAPGPWNAAPPVTAPLLYLCDHRGGELERAAEELARRGLRVRTSHGLRDSLERIRVERPDLIVVDPLSRRGRVELERLDRARREGPLIPLLVVTERDDRRAMPRTERALEGELWDVIPRDASPEELYLRLQRLLSLARMLHEMDDLRHRAAHDDRTDLLRPEAFEARLSEHFSAAGRHHFPLALVIIDLDDFGRINKDHDHTVGDELIRRVGAVIRRNLRTEDVAGRLGGDEFGVLLPYTAKVDAAQVVRRLREEIHKLSGEFPGVEGTIRVSASLGFETYDGTDLDSLPTLRRNAERALRAAKRGGGDQGLFWRNLAEAGRTGPTAGGAAN